MVNFEPFLLLRVASCRENFVPTTMGVVLNQVVRYSTYISHIGSNEPQYSKITIPWS